MVGAAAPGRRGCGAWSSPTCGAGSRRRRTRSTSPARRCGRRSTRSRSLNARQSDIDEMRRQIYPLARRLAARLAKEQHARRRGPLDFRRTVRASVSTGGVPLVTHHRPSRPHRPELVVLCDVSGSVANFASFTLLLVYALREQFGKVRAFTFVDDVHEVTDEFVPGADLEETLTRLAASARHASLWGRTDYGRAFRAVPGEVPRRARPEVQPARPRRRPLQLHRPAARQLRDMVDASPSCLVAQPGGPAAVGHRRLRRARVRRGRRRWSSAATSPSSRSSCTTSSEPSRHVMRVSRLGRHEGVEAGHRRRRRRPGRPRGGRPAHAPADRVDDVRHRVDRHHGEQEADRGLHGQRRPDVALVDHLRHARREQPGVGDDRRSPHEQHGRAPRSAAEPNTSAAATQQVGADPHRPPATRARPSRSPSRPPDDAAHHAREPDRRERRQPDRGARPLQVPSTAKLAVRYAGIHVHMAYSSHMWPK